jgi:hypothetical protein
MERSVPVTGEPWSADPSGPLDELDSAMLQWVEDFYTVTDPVPRGLLERVRFAMDLLDPDFEVALLQDDRFETVGVRGAERSRTVTFDSESLTIVIQAGEGEPEGAVRVDGWLAPPAVRRVRVRAGETELHTESDEIGGFVLTRVPRGLVQLIVEVEDVDSRQARTVVTAAVLL